MFDLVSNINNTFDEIQHILTCEASKEVRFSLLVTFVKNPVLQFQAITEENINKFIEKNKR